MLLKESSDPAGKPDVWRGVRYTHSGHGRDRTSMHRGLTPLRLDGFGEGNLAGREPGNRFYEGRDLASLPFLYQPNRPHFIKHAARYNTYE